MTLRVVLFVDYQNVYAGARETFHGQSARAPSSWGQILPRKLGEYLCRAGSPDSSPDVRELREVRVYRGMPKRDSGPYAAAQRQHAAWEKDGVTVVTRPLQTRAAGVREKGIDVELALDFFIGAIDGAYDIGIIFSHDTDLIPAIEKVRDPVRNLNVTVETAAWCTSSGQAFQLVKGQGVWCHRLDERAYESARDRNNYTRKL